MTDVTHTFSAGETIQAANVNQNFSDVLGLISSLPASKLEGSIPYDKLLHNKGLSVSVVTLVPFMSGTDFATLNGFTLPASRPSGSNNRKIQPVMLPGWQASLCAILVHTLEYDTAATDNTYIDFRHNGSSQLGGGDVILQDNDYNTLIARNDPIQNPLKTFADGDYLELAIWGPSGTPEPRGITVTLVWKHRLVA